MLKDKRIAVTVPAYNEEILIEKTLKGMPPFVDMIVVVDDFSTDDTYQRARMFALRDKRITVIRHGRNQGVGGAILTGYRKALDKGADVVAVMAGDAQMYPGDLEAVTMPVATGEADYVKGNRLLSKDVKQVMPQLRYFGNSLLTILTKISTGYWHVMDPQCGYTAISRSALETIPLEEIYRKYGFPNDVLALLNVYNQRVKDVPVAPVYGEEKSKIRLKSYVPKVSWLLTKRFFWRLKEKYIIRNFHPLVLFYIFGFLSFLSGIILGIRVILFRLAEGAVPASSAILVALLLLFGIQSLFFAMFFDMDFNRRLEV